MQTKRPGRTCRSISAAVGALGIALWAGGCATSDQARKWREARTTLSNNSMTSAAEGLVNTLAAEPGWKRFEAANRGPGREQVVICMNKFDNRTQDDLWDRKYFKDFIAKLSTSFASTGVATFQQSLRKDCPNYFEAYERVREQDTDPNYDQGTGKMVTGRLMKATVYVALDVCKATALDGNGVSSDYEYRLMVYDAERGTLICAPKWPQ